MQRRDHISNYLDNLCGYSLHFNTRCNEVRERLFQVTDAVSNVKLETRTPPS